MPTESLAAAPAGMRKGTCDSCKHTVLRATVDGKEIVLDAELLAVVSDNPRDRTERRRLSGRRLHADSCERLKRQAERDQINREKAQWLKEQAAKLAKAKPANGNGSRAAAVADDAAKLLAELNKQAEQLRDAHVATMAAHRKVTQRLEAVAKRGRRARGM